MTFISTKIHLLCTELIFVERFDVISIWSADEYGTELGSRIGGGFVLAKLMYGDGKNESKFCGVFLLTLTRDDDDDDDSDGFAGLVRNS